MKVTTKAVRTTSGTTTTSNTSSTENSSTTAETSQDLKINIKLERNDEMGKYFGTDGVKAERKLTYKLALN